MKFTGLLLYPLVLVPVESADVYGARYVLHSTPDDDLRLNPHTYRAECLF